MEESLRRETLAILQDFLKNRENNAEIDEEEDEELEEKPEVVEEDRVRSSHPNTVFSKKEYWNERFTEEEAYDWLVKFDELSKHILCHLNRDDRILVIGCGNSSFSQELYDAGFENVTNIDFSDVVIDKMRAMHQEIRPKMQWICADMCNLVDTHFSPNSFDVIIDKATIDAIMVDEGDVWDPDLAVIEKCDQMLQGFSILLDSSKGKLISLSFAQPHFRTKYLHGYRASLKKCGSPSSTSTSSSVLPPIIV